MPVTGGAVADITSVEFDSPQIQVTFNYLATTDTKINGAVVVASQVSGARGTQTYTPVIDGTMQADVEVSVSASTGTFATGEAVVYVHFTDHGREVASASQRVILA